MSASANPRRPPKPLHWFAAHAIALALLLGWWPAPRDAYPALFHAHANALLASLAEPHVRLESPAPGSGAPLDTDTVMFEVPRAGMGPPWQSFFSIVRIGYWPSVLIAALLLAT